MDQLDSADSPESKILEVNLRLGYILHRMLTSKEIVGPMRVNIKNGVDSWLVILNTDRKVFIPKACGNISVDKEPKEKSEEEPELEKAGEGQADWEKKQPPVETAAGRPVRTINIVFLPLPLETPSPPAKKKGFWASGWGTLTKIGIGAGIGLGIFAALDGGDGPSKSSATVVRR